MDKLEALANDMEDRIERLYMDRGWTSFSPSQFHGVVSSSHEDVLRAFGRLVGREKLVVMVTVWCAEGHAIDSMALDKLRPYLVGGEADALEIGEVQLDRDCNRCEPGDYGAGGVTFLFEIEPSWRERLERKKKAKLSPANQPAPLWWLPPHPSLPSKSCG